MCSKSKDLHRYKERGTQKKRTHRGKDHTWMVTEVGVTELQVKQSQGFASNHQKQEETRKDPPLESLGELGPADTSISDFYPPELGQNKFLLL